MSKSITIQGRIIYPQTISGIRRTVAYHPEWHRTRLLKELCKRWGWRTDTGQLKDMACRNLLNKEDSLSFRLPSTTAIANDAYPMFPMFVNPLRAA